MKLKFHLLGFGLLGIVAATVVAVIGMVAAQRQASTLQTVLTASEAEHRAMNADMMHDAIRSDVLGIALAATQANHALLEGSKKDEAEHAKVLREDFAALAALDLPASLQDGLKAMQPVMEAYLAATERVVRADTGTDAKELAAAMAGFQGAFADFEVRMAKFDEGIVRSAGQAAADAQGAAAQTPYLLGGALLLALVSVAMTAVGLSKHLTRPLQVAMDVAERIAAGDLSQSVVAESKVEEFHTLMQRLDHMQVQLRDLTNNVRRHAETVASASTQVNAASETLIQNTQVHAATMGDSTEALQRISGEIQNNLRQTHQANQLAEGASQVASRGGEVVGQVVETMRGINTTSRRIHDIIGVIDGIAFQTNILALNAAVEAARAGEQGRGFAVVASEVRSLAQRSANAAKEIKSLITASVEHVEHGTTLVDNAGTTMQEIVTAIQQVRELMERLSRDSQTHADDIDSVQRTVTRLDSATRDNAGLVEESARSAASLHREADQLMDAVASFKMH